MRSSGKAVRLQEQVIESLSCLSQSSGSSGNPGALNADQSFPEFSLDEDQKVGPGSSRKARIW